jgi:hypothetical protein
MKNLIWKLFFSKYYGVYMQKNDMGRVDIHGRRETECADVHWIHLAQDRGQLQPLVNTITDIQVG